MQPLLRITSSGSIPSLKRDKIGCNFSMCACHSGSICLSDSPWGLSTLRPFLNLSVTYLNCRAIERTTRLGNIFALREVVILSCVFKVAGAGESADNLINQMAFKIL